MTGCCDCLCTGTDKVKVCCDCLCTGTDRVTVCCDSQCTGNDRETCAVTFSVQKLRE